METQTVAANHRIAPLVDGLLCKLQFDYHNSAISRSPHHRNVAEHWDFVLRIHGHAGGLLHKRHKYFSWDQRTRSWTIFNHRQFDHRLQHHSNPQRLRRRKAPAIALLHDPLFRNDLRPLEL